MCVCVCVCVCVNTPSSHDLVPLVKPSLTSTVVRDIYLF